MTTRFTTARTSPAPVAHRVQQRSLQYRRYAAPVLASSGAATQEPTITVEEAASTLRQAASNSSVPPVEVFQALRTLDKAKLSTDGWDTVLGGTKSPGKTWKLVFTTGTKQVQEALKGVSKGGGSYFPLTAVQRWDGEKQEIENGVHLGHVAALTFKGPYAMVGKKLSFDFDSLTIRLGPGKWTFPLKAKITNYQPGPKDPFFLFFYADETFIAARGRGGGLAFWSKTSSEWELKNGIV